MRIQLIVFDMAGTTVRDDDAVNLCLRDSLAAHCCVTTRDEVNEVMGIAKPVAIRTLLERRAGAGQAVSASAVELIHEDFLRRMIRHYQTSDAVEPMPCAVEVFRQLKAAGVKLALDTGFSRPIVNAILVRLGWHQGGLLDATVASDEVPRGRPYPDMVFKAMELTDVASVAAVAKVGDTPSDLQEGRAAGCGLVIGVTNGTHTAVQLAGHPHTHLIAGLHELSSLVLAS